jgi:DNA-binding Lrp family transcriptional regulator
VFFDELDQRLIREVQADIPLTLDPYGEIAARLGCGRDEVLRRLRNYAEQGIMKRVGAILHHRDSGFAANAMLVCAVAEERIAEAGERLAGLPQVSHCYQRLTTPDWPYNLYGMIHGRTTDEVERLARQFVVAMGIAEYQILYSVRELKKTSLKFF